MIILDFSSGNTCQNNEREAKAMIDALAEIDPKRKAVIKWQLWDKDNRQGDNITLDWLLFHAMAMYAYERYGYKTTASVFDVPSVDFLQTISLPYELPFIKIACNPDLYYLTMEIKRKIPVIKSYDNIELAKRYDQLFCVKKYPAKLEDYPTNAKLISDHTPDLQLYKRNKPAIIEMHYALKGQRGLDVESGVCKTPEMLRGIL